MAKRTTAKTTRERNEHSDARASDPGKAATDGAEATVAMNQRLGKDRRSKDRREKDVPVAVERRQVERRAKVNRRRQIDPTTCERDYSHEEIEFMRALDEYKRRNGRMFPTCSEVLEVIKALGYEKRPATSAAEVSEQPTATVTTETAV
jgi:hypothetical protein